MLPLSKKEISFRPFLVKEQKMLLLGMESEDKEDIERNIRQVLNNCTQTPGINIEELPILDMELYFIHLRARSVGEIVENKYRCENVISPEGSPTEVCGGSMPVSINLLDIKPNMENVQNNVIKITDSISVTMRYPRYGASQKASKQEKVSDMAFDVIVDSIESVWDGEKMVYSSEVTREDLVEFIESLNKQQFASVEGFFDTLPILNKKITTTCGKCGFNHTIEVEGLQNFFG